MKLTLQEHSSSEEVEIYVSTSLFFKRIFVKMTRTIRNHITGLILKAFGTTDSLSVPSVLRLNLTSDIQDNNVIIKIPEKLVKDLFQFDDGQTILRLPPDNLVQRIKLLQYSGHSFYTFQVCKYNFIEQVLNKDEEIERKTISSEKERIIVEYSSPNIAKPFHMGHFRSTVVGQFVANVLDFSNNVIRLNYLGDWGTQFGLIQAGLKSLSIDIDNIKENPLELISRAYVHANENRDLTADAKLISSTLEKTEQSHQLNVWKKLRELTVQHLEHTYSLLGIHFDEYAWESQYAADFKPILDDMMKHGIVENINGQLVLSRGERKVGLMKSDGTSLYLSRDISAALDRYRRYGCKSMKYVIDKSQEEHVDDVKYVVSLLTGVDIIEHVKFGRIVGMSTRKGTGIFLSDILQTATEIMAQQQENSPNTRNQDPEVTRVLAVSTLIIYMLKQRRAKDFTFDWNTALQGKGDSGVKLQYTHSRLCSLEQNCGVKLPTECLPRCFTQPEALSLISLLDKHDQILMSSQTSLESSHLVNYLFKLCNATSLCLKKLPVKGESQELAEQRLLLFHKARLVLKSTMLILGLKPLDSM